MSGITLYTIRFGASWGSGDDSILRCTLKRANQNRCWADKTQVRIVFCFQSLDSVRHFLRWLSYRGTDESQSKGLPSSSSLVCTVWDHSLHFLDNDKRFLDET